MGGVCLEDGFSLSWRDHSGRTRVEWCLWEPRKNSPDLLTTSSFYLVPPTPLAHGWQAHCWAAALTLKAASMTQVREVRTA